MLQEIVMKLQRNEKIFNFLWTLRVDTVSFVIMYIQTFEKIPSTRLFLYICDL